MMMTEDFDPIEDMRKCAKTLVDAEIKKGSGKTAALQRISLLTGVPAKSIDRIISGAMNNVSMAYFNSIIKVYLDHVSRSVEATANNFIASRHTMDPETAASLEKEIEAMRAKIEAARNGGKAR